MEDALKILFYSILKVKSMFVLYTFQNICYKFSKNKKIMYEYYIKVRVITFRQLI